MTLQIRFLDNRELLEWDAFVMAHPNGTIYHTAAWRQLIFEVYGHVPLYFAIYSDSRSIVGGLPAFLVRSRLTGTRLATLPCAQYCDPLVSSKEQYEALKHRVLDHMAEHQIPSWEMKTTHSFSHEPPPSSMETSQYMTHILKLGMAYENIYKGFHKNLVQRSIKKAYRNGLTLKRCQSQAEIVDFYDLYMQMRRTKGLLPQPRCYFEALWKLLKPLHQIEVLFALHGQQKISAILLLKYKDSVIYEYGATMEGMHQYSPSPFLLGEAIHEAADQGFRYFDFGRTSVTETGLAQFKSHWGAEQQNLRCFNMATSAPMSSMRQNTKTRTLMALAIKLLPKSACERVALPLYKHLV
jgi:lipid II:glycine glycyltransferase (peptidoglycan interpeptide bridge formation enzyme)